jgi:hypothetical protein
MINYLKRMYNASPFEGAKIIESYDETYYVAVISINFNSNTLEINNDLARKKAQDAAKITFAEPCVKFEMLSTLKNDSSKINTYFFSCTPLSKFAKEAYLKQLLTGAKIISAPNSNYFVSVIAMDTLKNTSKQMTDRVALIKAKQQANALFNGSTITSEIIIKTDEVARSTTSTEIIKEQSMGFVEGLETLLKFPANGNIIYVFYRELLNK